MPEWLKRFLRPAGRYGARIRDGRASTACTPATGATRGRQETRDGDTIGVPRQEISILVMLEWLKSVFMPT
jgi:hypothetical protein